VKPTRFRVPDVAVVLGHPGERILTRPVCVEILSPEDSMSAMQEKIDDYLAFGVTNVWVVDPRRNKALRTDLTSIHEAADGVLKVVDAPFSLGLSSMWVKHVRLIHQPILHSKPDQLPGAMQIQLLHNLPAVRIDGINAEVQLGRDFLVRLAFGDQLEHFPLAS
jgi:hypothetical protein